MSELPWFKFYPNDFMGDMNLRRCTNEAVGVYIKFLCLAFDSEERGVLITAGMPWTDREIVCAIGGHYDDTLRAFQELVRWNLIKIRKDGAYFNSRMTRDDADRKGSNKRVQDWREKQKDKSSQNKKPPDVTANVTDSVTPNVTSNVTDDVTEMKRGDIRSQKSEVRNQKSEIRNQKSEVEDSAQARPTAASCENSVILGKPEIQLIQNPKEEIPPDSAPPPFVHPRKTILSIEVHKDRWIQDQISYEAVCMAYHLGDVSIFEDWLTAFNHWRKMQGTTTDNEFNYRKHFLAWLPKQDLTADPRKLLENKLKNQNHGQHTGKKGNNQSYEDRFPNLAKIAKSMGGQSG